ncbi:DUF3500 domain-containing protein [Natribacillus halophilus]|uniref:DUF3500 domain-containing protein n=1 Tax=Natribacillus halophilus TaxID=549003 RepID=A0A1G8S6G5_9BACI|nr:DUF3500 domain-containing protein [Natribacillus halophilus]SDJ24763.1 Protein of unknown function [Natribacillus halophilus]
MFKTGKLLLLAGMFLLSSVPIDAEAETITKAQSEETANLLQLIDESLHERVNEEEQVALAETFLETLTDEQQEKVHDDLNEENATTWTNLPATYENRNGMALGDLSEESIKAALRLMKTSLSEEGYTTLTEIIKADAFQHTEYGEDQWGPELYFIAILGTPSEIHPWMIQFSGHHLAENLVFNGEEASATPQFTGVEPTEFTLWDEQTYRPLDERVNGVYAMLDSLDDEQLKNAEIAEAFDGVAVGPGEDGNFPQTEGIVYGDLNTKQQKLVQNAITAWIKDAPDKTKRELQNAYFSEEALQNTHVAWAGSTDPDDDASYVRIDGPRVWIELSSQEGEGHPENPHFHTVWRDKIADYGEMFTQ